VAAADAGRDLGEDPIRFDGEARTPFGANFVVRTQEQRSVRYDPELGLKPGGSLGGEETEVVSKLLRLGYEGWRVPSASVRHYIPAERMTTQYIRGFSRGQGEFLTKTESPRQRAHVAWQAAVVVAPGDQCGGRILASQDGVYAGSLGTRPMHRQLGLGQALWEPTPRLMRVATHPTSIQDTRPCGRRGRDMSRARKDAPEHLVRCTRSAQQMWVPDILAS